MRILSSFLDFIFPPRPYAKIVRSLTTLPRTYNSFGTVIYLSNFANPAVKATVVENKFHANQEASHLLAELLEEWLKRQTGEMIMIPVPLSRTRMKERGYNQVSEILNIITSDKVAVREDMVKRVKDTLPQTSLSKNERLENVKGAFSINENVDFKLLASKTIVIVDDVVTTGATLGAVKAELSTHLPASSKVITLALAH